MVLPSAAGTRATSRALGERREAEPLFGEAPSDVVERAAILLRRGSALRVHERLLRHARRDLRHLHELASSRSARDVMSGFWRRGSAARGRTHFGDASRRSIRLRRTGRRQRRADRSARGSRRRTCRCCVAESPRRSSSLRAPSRGPRGARPGRSSFSLQESIGAAICRERG